MLLLIKKIIQPLLLKRKADSNKSTFGHALIIAGTKGKMGAAVIAAMACLRSGCGLLTVHVPVQERLVLQTTLPEAMVMFRRKTIKQLDDYSAIGIGPGLGAVVLTKLLLLQIFMEYKMPVVLDDDALNVLAAYPKLILKIPKHTILTPHQVEFDRLFGVHKNTAQRLRTAMEKAKALSITIILKSYKTFITNGENHYTNTTGNTSLAKAGSGDALTGVVTSLLAQGYTAINAAITAVYVHGLAADIALKNESAESILITDVIAKIGKAFILTSKKTIKKN